MVATWTGVVAIEAGVVVIQAWGACYRGQGWLLLRPGVVVIQAGSGCYMNWDSCYRCRTGWLLHELGCMLWTLIMVVILLLIAIWTVVLYLLE